MKKIFLTFIFIAGFCLVSCKKESTVVKDSFFSIVQTDLDYTTRSCFQLKDGSFIICGSNVPWISGNVNFGTTNAVMAKFSITGDVIWHKELPGILYDLWKGLALPDGSFVLTGFDSSTTNQNMNIVHFSAEGDLIKSKQIVNINSATGAASVNQADFILLKNSNYAIVLKGSDQFVIGSSPRVILLDKDFTILNDKIYLPLFNNYESYWNSRIAEGPDGDLYIAGRKEKSNFYVGTFLMRVDGTTLDMEYIRVNIGSDSTSVPGPFVVNKNGKLNITTAEQFNADNTLYFQASNYFYFHDKECFSVGKKVSILQTDTAGNFISRYKFSGFPSFGCLNNIVQTMDGGYLLIGTVNLKSDAVIYSPSQIMLIKTDGQMNQQWMKIVNTSYLAIAVDVKQLNDGGFLIGAIIKSFNINNKMVLIKTDANGNL